VKPAVHCAAFDFIADQDGPGHRGLPLRFNSHHIERRLLTPSFQTLSQHVQRRISLRVASCHRFDYVVRYAAPFGRFQDTGSKFRRLEYASATIRTLFNAQVCVKPPLERSRLLFS
jgi:hypothetical protein